MVMEAVGGVESISMDGPGQNKKLSPGRWAVVEECFFPLLTKMTGDTSMRFLSKIPGVLL